MKRRAAVTQTKGASQQIWSRPRQY